MTFQDGGQMPDLQQLKQLNSDVLDSDPSEQWFFQFNEALLLTVQAFQRLHAALNDKMP